MISRGWKALSATLGLALVAGCAPGPAGSFTDTASPAYRMKSYYERNANTEQLGQCDSLIFEDVLRLEVLDETDQQSVLQVRYAYSGESRGGSTPLIRCDGFATRVFTLAKTADGPEVVDMSDPIR